MPSDDEIAIRAAVSQWFDVLNAMLNGDAEPLAALYSHNDDVTYMGAEGTYRVGWSATFADWKAQAKKDIGGSAEGRDIHVVVSGDLATASHLTVSSIANAQGEKWNEHRIGGADREVMFLTSADLDGDKLLTTGNPQSESDRDLFDRLGIEPSTSDQLRID